MKVYPSRIRLEASTACQLRCPVCPTGQQKTRHTVCGSGVLRFEDFRQLLDRNPFVREIELSNWGEVFLNRELPQVLDYAFRCGVKITISNGANLNHASAEMLETLVRTRVEELTVALDGATPETYARYRIRGSFDRVIAHVKVINEWKKHYGSDRPRLIWQYIVFGHNEHEIEAAKAMAGTLDMTFSPKLNVVPDFSPVNDADRVLEATGLGKVAADADWGNVMCSQLWTSPQINWDGKVLGCCHNNWQEFGGNAFRDGLASSLNSEKLMYARRMLAGEAPPRSDIPCSSCEFYQRMASQESWVDPSRMRLQMLVERVFPGGRRSYRSLRRKLSALNWHRSFNAAP